MTVNLQAPESLLPIAGVKLSAVASGIKKNQTKDLVLISFEQDSICSAVFTKNRFRAAPVQIAASHLEKSGAQLLLINSGNANAGTGESGYKNAISTCELASEVLNIHAENVLPFSTGVIGEDLPVACFENALPSAVEKLSEDNWLTAAEGIMTTDTVAKGISKQITVNDKKITITGIAKGSGMIRPDMATMLSYVATDAKINKAILDKALTDSVNASFNSITVDSDTSTNDSCVLIATGKAGSEISSDQDYQTFYSALLEVMMHLAHAIIRDGEGATKFVAINVKNALTENDARTVAYTVAHSPLVKTALFASDPNWGRILAAVGRSEIDVLDVDKIDIFLDKVCIVHAGGKASGYTEEAGQQVMSSDEISITVDLNLGDSSATVWTTDLSYDYVKINAEYRS